MKLKLSLGIVIIVGLVGSITMLLVYNSQKSISSTYEKNLPLIGLSDYVRYNVTKGHLWFEEYMAGDNSIHPEKDVIKLFIESRTLLDSMVRSENETSSEVLSAELTLIIKRGIKEIEALETITKQRWENKIENDPKHDSVDVHNTEQAGGNLDQIFDEKYEMIQTTMEELSGIVQAKVKNDIQSATTIGLITLVVILIIFIAIAFLFYRFQRKNEITSEEQKLKMAHEETKIKKMTFFADAIGQGNYQAEIDLQESEQDNLTHSLSSMRDKLKKVAEEDQKRTWMNVGLAEIGEILRSNSDDYAKFYFNVNSYIVKYLKATQGGLFIIKEEEDKKYIEMVSCIAYDRKKALQKKILWGEGLIGRCVQESESIYLTEIPDDYVSITSGLGQSNPSNILIVPLKMNEKIFGVIEIASFSKMENYQIEFVEKIAESIASVINNMEINTRTKALLEQSQQQTEELRSQEEEMRQNMEELVATQEEIQRKEQLYLEEIRDLKNKLEVSQ